MRGALLAPELATHSSGAKKAGLPAVLASSTSSAAAAAATAAGSPSAAAARWLARLTWETPKSEIFTRWCSSQSRFAGLMSRWMIPW